MEGELPQIFTIIAVGIDFNSKGGFCLMCCQWITEHSNMRCTYCKFWFYFKNQGKAGHEIQSSTLELINGLVSLVHQATMPDVAQEAMEALLVLHNPDKIEVWNPEAPINTFWDVRWSIFSSCFKLTRLFDNVKPTTCFAIPSTLLIRYAFSSAGLK